jgi:hypothetical protein
MVLGSEVPLSAARVARARLPRELAPVAQRAARIMAPGLRGGDVYTDDHAPVEWLIDASILKVAAHGER